MNPDEYEFYCRPAKFVEDTYTPVYDDDYVIEWGVWREHHDHGGEGG